MNPKDQRRSRLPESPEELRMWARLNELTGSTIKLVIEQMTGDRTFTVTCITGNVRNLPFVMSHAVLENLEINPSETGFEIKVLGERRMFFSIGEHRNDVTGDNAEVVHTDSGIFISQLFWRSPEDRVGYINWFILIFE